METVDKLTATRGKGEGEEWWQEGKGNSQRTRMNDPWTWTMVWGWTVVDGAGQRRTRGEIGTTVIE